MRAGIACTALAAILLSSPAAAQQVRAAESHILSAFTSRPDPRVIAEGARLGPTLRLQLGGEADRAKIHASLVERTAGRRLSVNLVAPAEAARYLALVGNASDPLVLLEAGDVTLLMQYAPTDRAVTFVEQLSGPAPRSDAPQLPAELPKAAPIVGVPLPAAPPPAPVAPPPPLIVKKAAPTPLAEKAKPLGECVIKPVMSDDDLRNCGARP